MNFVYRSALLDKSDRDTVLHCGVCH